MLGDTWERARGLWIEASECRVQEGLPGVDLGAGQAGAYTRLRVCVRDVVCGWWHGVGGCGWDLDRGRGLRHKRKHLSIEETTCKIKHGGFLE